MRITIETTNSEPDFSRKGVVEVPHDAVDIFEMAALLRGALVGAGFQPKSVNSILPLVPPVSHCDHTTNVSTNVSIRDRE